MYTCNTELKLSNGIQYFSAVQTQNTVATFVPAAVDEIAAAVDVAVAVAADFEKPG